MDARVIVPTHAAQARVRAEWLLLALVIGVAAALRLSGLDRESFWFDESGAAFLSDAPAADVFSGRARDTGNPPGFFLLGHAWQMLVGHSDFALRLLPALLGIASVFALYQVARDLAGTRVAMLSAALLAINPGHIYLSHEYRVYTLQTLLTITTLGAAVRYDERRSWRALALFFVSALLGIWCHYYAALTVGAACLWVLRRWREPRHLWPWMAMLLLLLLGISPLLREIGYSAHERVLEAGGASSRLHLAATPLTVLFGRSLAWKADGRMAVMAATLLSALLIAVTLWLARKPPLRARALLYLACLFPLVVAAALAFGAGMQSWDDRKVLMILPPLLVLMSVGLLSAPRPVRIALLTGLFAGSALAMGRYIDEPHRDDWRGAWRFIAPQLQAGDAVLVMPDFEIDSVDRYARQSRGTAPPAFGFAPTGEYFDLDRLGSHHHGTAPPPALRTARRVWVVRNCYMPGCDFDQPLQALRLRPAAPAVDTRLARDLEVRLYYAPP